MTDTTDFTGHVVDAVHMPRLADLSDDTSPYPSRIGIFCDGCGAEVLADYLVAFDATREQRYEVAREHLRGLGWSCTEAGDLCPDCQGPANDRETDPEPVDTCRPVTVEVDGEQITTIVRGGEEMSEEGLAAFAQIMSAARRKLEADRAANPPNPADYPMDVVLDGDLVHKAKPMGAVGRRVTTLCGINARHVPGRDGGLRCPNCQELGAKP